jgi:hypothetical protein
MSLSGNSRVEGTLDVVGGLLNVGLLGVGLNSSSDLVGEGLSALVELVKFDEEGKFGWR